jgi:hypothetical protein
MNAAPRDIPQRPITTFWVAATVAWTLERSTDVFATAAWHAYARQSPVRQSQRGLNVVKASVRQSQRRLNVVKVPVRESHAPFTYESCPRGSRMARLRTEAVPARVARRPERREDDRATVAERCERTFNPRTGSALSTFCRGSRDHVPCPREATAGACSTGSFWMTSPLRELPSAVQRTGPVDVPAHADLPAGRFPRI